MKQTKRILSVLLVAVLALSLFACGKKGAVDPQSFVKQFNKACDAYQINADEFTGKENADNTTTYSYTFKSDDTTVGTFLLSAFTATGSSDIYKVSILLPLGTYSTAGDAIAESRRTAFLSIAQSLLEVIKDTDAKDAKAILDSMKFNENDIYNKKGTTEIAAEQADGFYISYTTLPLLNISTFTIENTALAPTTTQAGTSAAQ